MCWSPAVERDTFVGHVSAAVVVEVLDAEFSAQLWRGSHGPALMEASITRGGVDWNWDHHEWGVIFEVSFRDAETWSRGC